MTIAERINAERVVLAGWSRAILLQLAHPLVAQGVADHSSFGSEGEGDSPKPATEPTGTARGRRRRRHAVLGGGAPASHRPGDAASDLRRRAPQGGARRHSGDPSPRQRHVGRRRRSLPGRHPLLRRRPGSRPLGPRDAARFASTRVRGLVRPISDDERDAWCRESAPVARALGVVTMCRRPGRTRRPTCPRCWRVAGSW